MMQILLKLALASGLCLSAITAAGAQTSDADKAAASATRMVEKPLKDLNVKQDEIPAVLQAIMAKPYDISKLKTCADFQKEVAALTKVLGPDVDSAAAMQSGQNPTEFVLGTAEAVAGTLIPGTGLIRKFSGAEAAEKKAKAAVLAGQLRRAYIRGVARGTNCKIS